MIFLEYNEEEDVVVQDPMDTDCLVSICMFFQLVKQCTIIVVYSVGTSEKAQLTRFLKSNGLTTCSVGDGANDIEMIEESHVGVGIKAGENQHVASSADIAIRTVTDLPLVLFDYGKQNCERNAALTILM